MPVSYIQHVDTGTFIYIYLSYTTLYNIFFGTFVHQELLSFRKVFHLHKKILLIILFTFCWILCFIQNTGQFMTVSAVL